MSKPRARSATGRLIHYRVNPPRVPVTCKICRKVTLERASQHRVYCSMSCARLGDYIRGTIGYAQASQTSS